MFRHSRSFGEAGFGEVTSNQTEYDAAKNNTNNPLVSLCLYKIEPILNTLFFHRSTHRLQVVGLEGAGKSTLIHQLRLLDSAAARKGSEGKKEYFTEERRRERLAQIRALVRDSAQALAQGMKAEGIAPEAEGDDEKRKEVQESLDWLAGHATRTG